MTSVEVNARIAALEKELPTLPIGYLVLKKSKAKSTLLYLFHLNDHHNSTSNMPYCSATGSWLNGIAFPRLASVSS